MRVDIFVGRDRIVVPCASVHILRTTPAPALFYKGFSDAPYRVSWLFVCCLFIYAIILEG